VTRALLRWDNDNALAAKTCWAITLPSETRKPKAREELESLMIQ